MTGFLHPWRILHKRLIIHPEVQAVCYGVFAFFLIHKAHVTGKHWIMLAPFAVLLLISFLMNSRLIIYTYLASFYLGMFSISKWYIAVTPSDVLFVMMLWAAFFTFVQSSCASIHSNTRTISWLLMLLLCWMSLSLLYNVDSQQHWALITAGWYWLNFLQLILGWHIALIIFRNISRNTLINIILIIGLFQCCVASLQWLHLGATSIDHLRAVTGTLGEHHSMLANMMLFPLGFSIYRLTQSTALRQRVAYTCCAFAVFWTIIITGSRSTLLGIVAAILILLRPRLNLKSIAIILLTMASVYVAIRFTLFGDILWETVRSETTGGLDYSSQSRLLIWKSTLQNFISSSPLTKVVGFGLGFFHTIKHDFFFFYSRSASGAHNNYLHVLTEGGVVGLGIFIALFITILRQLHHAGRSDRAARVYFFITIALLVSGLTQETFWFQPAFPNLWLFYMTLLAAILVSARNQQNPINEIRTVNAV